jgi:hypothetical protein
MPSWETRSDVSPPPWWCFSLRLCLSSPGGGYRGSVEPLRSAMPTTTASTISPTKIKNHTSRVTRLNPRMADDQSSVNRKLTAITAAARWRSIERTPFTSEQPMRAMVRSKPLEPPFSEHLFPSFRPGVRSRMSSGKPQRRTRATHCAASRRRIFPRELHMSESIGTGAAIVRHAPRPYAAAPVADYCSAAYSYPTMPHVRFCAGGAPNNGHPYRNHRTS